MIVVASTLTEVEAAQHRLRGLGLQTGDVLAPSPSRRLVLAAGDGEGEEERVAATLRAEGITAVARPDTGPRLDAWRCDTQPRTFGDRLTVCFAWSEHDRDGLPGLVELGTGGFGSGEHPTTQLLIEELLARLTGGERVLDVGCGSGVLGLSALQLGAAGGVAVDLEPEAIEATRRNAALNGMEDRLVARHRPLSELSGEFDVIVANVGRAAIVDLASELTRLLAPAGWLGVSGISPAQCSQVGGFLYPLTEERRRTEGDWASVVFARASDGEG